jgi:peroxiredoxin Q/BCP
LWFLKNRAVSQRSPQIRPKHAEGKPIGDWSTQPEATDEPSLVRPYTLTAGRTDAGIDLALEAPIEAVEITAKPPRWPKHDVRGRILASSAQRPSVAEIAAELSLPIGATRFLVDELVTQGYLRVRAPLNDSMTVDERRELITRTLHGLRALQGTA